MNGRRWIRIALIVFAVSVSGGWARPIDPSDAASAVERYCNTVYVLAQVILGGRDGGIGQSTMRREILSVESVANHPKLRRDVLDIIHLAYVIAPNQPGDDLATFVLNDWCLGELQ